MYVFVRQKKYKEEAEKTMSHYVPVLDTPEMQRVRENQKNFSTVSNACKGYAYRTYTVSLCLSKYLHSWFPTSLLNADLIETIFFPQRSVFIDAFQ